MKPETKAFKKLTEKQKIFCREYIIDWNATRACKKAHPKYSDVTAGSEGYKYLKKPQIQEYINVIKDKIEEMAGVSKLKVVMLANSIAFGKDENTDNSTRLQAARTLNEMLGYKATEKTELTGKDGQPLIPDNEIKCTFVIVDKKPDEK